MNRFFKPYEGRRPFLFISYAHRQSETVVETIRILHEGGCRLWYDEGIPAGSDWPANIAWHMQQCDAVVYFLSARAMESPNCYSEIRTAVRLRKPILVVRLEDAAVEPRWQELLAGRQEIPLIPDAAERADAIARSGFLKRRYYHSFAEKIPWQALGFAASLLFFLAAAGMLAALATGHWTPIPPPEPVPPAVTPAPTPAPTLPPVVELGGAERYFAVRFPDSQQERAVRRALEAPDGEIYRWQLAELRELYFCGNVVADSLEGVRFDADGTCRVNGAPVVTGRVSDLSLLESVVNLETLALVCQPADSLAPLNGLTRLRELSLAGSPTDELSALRELPSLEILHLEHTAIRDLTPLEAFPKLKTVTVSREMLPLTWKEDLPFAVVLVKDS